jgi:hypothetical protein
MEEPGTILKSFNIWKTTSMEDYPNDRRTKWKATPMEGNLNERRPQCKMTVLTIALLKLREGKLNVENILHV